MRTLEFTHFSDCLVTNDTHHSILVEFDVEGSEEGYGTIEGEITLWDCMAQKEIYMSDLSTEEQKEIELRAQDMADEKACEIFEDDQMRVAEDMNDLMRDRDQE